MVNNSHRFRKNPAASWTTDSQCLTAVDARQVVSHYRAAYSPTRFQWLMKQAIRDTPYEECRVVFEEAL